MNSERGFTLLEVMVATAILAVGLTTVIAAVGMAVRSTSLAAHYEQARLLAESQLAAFLAERPERAAEREGQQGTLRWRIEAKPHIAQKGLLRVEAKVRFFAPGGERILAVETWEAARTLPKTYKLEGGS